MIQFLKKMPYFRTVTAGTAFGLFLVSGISWVTISRFMPDGIATQVVISTIGVVFVAIFFWLLISNISDVISGKGRVIPAMIIILVNLALLLAAFAWAYKMIGIIPSRPDVDAKEVHNFWDCLYFSAITLTTAGYGDFYPTGAGKFLACLEALTGYVILGLLASAGASIMQRREKETEEKEDAEKDSS